MISDAAKIIGGEHVAVTGLMGPGVDPHLYKASEGDIAKLGEADLILYNGLNLEGKMGDLFVRMSREPADGRGHRWGSRRSLLRKPPEFLGHYDPHVWFDVSMWQYAVGRVREALGEVDPAHRDEYIRNAAAYLETIDEAHAENRDAMATMPRAPRVDHGARCVWLLRPRLRHRVVRTQAISTVAEVRHRPDGRGRRLHRRAQDQGGVRRVERAAAVVEAVVERCRGAGHPIGWEERCTPTRWEPPARPRHLHRNGAANVRTIVRALR